MDTRRLLTAIRKEPTRRQFDPERVRFRLRNASGEVRRRTASWQMPVDESGRLVAGSVVLTDRREKEVEFFNFGGTVERITTESALVYAFDSPAPILGLTAAGNTVSDQLAFETEGILGELEEQYEERYGRAFPKRLAEIDPVSLYVAIVNSILTRYEEAPRLEEAFHGLYDALREEKSRLQAQGVWPGRAPLAEELVLEDV